jgi:MFS family permease
MTFVFFGVPGIALAGLLFFTVKEPTRGLLDGLVVSKESEDLRTVARFLLSLPSFRHVVLAGSLNAFANYAMLSWAQAFLMRAHGLSIQDAGFTLALAMSASTTLGLWTSGYVSDRLSARDPRWYAWVPAGASVLTVPLLVSFLLAPSLGTAISFLVPAAFFNTMWLGTGNAMVQGLAKPRMRATAGAINVLFNSGIGYGLGPFTVGALSDWLAPSYGNDSLRYALLIAILPQLWAAVHSYLASRTLREDLRAKEES